MFTQAVNGISRYCLRSSRRSRFHVSKHNKFARKFLKTKSGDRKITSLTITRQINVVLAQYASNRKKMEAISLTFSCVEEVLQFLFAMWLCSLTKSGAFRSEIFVFNRRRKTCYF